MQSKISDPHASGMIGRVVPGSSVAGPTRNPVPVLKPLSGDSPHLKKPLCVSPFVPFLSPFEWARYNLEPRVFSVSGWVARRHRYENHWSVISKTTATTCMLHVGINKKFDRMWDTAWLLYVSIALFIRNDMFSASNFRHRGTWYFQPQVTKERN